MNRKKYMLTAACMCMLCMNTTTLAGSSADGASPVVAMASADAEQKVVYKGRVVDALTSEPVIGASVVVKGMTALGTVTDVDGHFTLSVSTDVNPVILIASYIGYESVETRVTRREGIEIRLTEKYNELNEVEVVAYGTQKKVSVTGAISSLRGEELLKSPSGSLGNALAGAVSGISTVQLSGQPGAEDPNIYVRGTGSLSEETSKPLILVDGVERSFFQMDPNEVESITVLKDAASTAVFGVRGANGVILVTTRRGTTGKPKISWSSSFGLTQALRNLKTADSYEHASIYTEAQRSDNPNMQDDQLAFSPYVTEMFRTNADPIIFPNTDWSDYLFNNLSWQTQHNVTISGGLDRFKYFVSLGYLHQDGMVKQFDLNYDPNYMYSRYNYRVNVDVNVSKTTTLKLNLGGRVGNRRSPRQDNLWQKIMWSTPYSSPGFVNGMRITKPNDKYISIGSGSSGLDFFYNYGYDKKTDNDLNIDLSLDQELGFITKGLRMNIKGAYNTNYSVTVSRAPTSGNPAVTPLYMAYFTQPGMDISNPLFDNTIVYQMEGSFGLNEPLSYNTSTGRGRNWYLEGSLNYARTFGNHEVSALFLYNQSKTYYPWQNTEIPTAYVGYVGRLTYNYKQRYLLDLNAGYNGSENFASGQRYGFFPAASIGWILSEEPFMKQLKWLDFLKVRASYGLVGNDKYNGVRFLYLNDSWSAYNEAWSSLGTWQFGNQTSPSMLVGAVAERIGNKNVSWEKVKKQNYGIDIRMFNQQLSITADLFFERRYDILSTRNTLPNITDVQLPLINLGKVNNKGYEVTVGWNSKAGKVDYWLQANLSYSKNKIIYMDEVVPNYPWMAQTGRSTGLNRGYLFDRFLSDSDFDENGSLKKDENGKQLTPVMALGNPRPGDALFKDLNGDNVIDGNDITYFGYGERPEYVMGFMYGARWKNFELSMQWTGAWNASRILGKEYRTPFGESNSGAILKYLADNRWTPENQNARFPRITFMNKTHYLTDSDLWMMDGSYLRLKTAELSYTFRNNPFLSKCGVSSLKFFVNGYNLLTLFSDLADIDIDPEGIAGYKNGQFTNDYPNVRIYNMGFNIQF